MVQIIMSGYARISIHALLAESDRVLEVTRNAHTDFYPRSPCGERRFSGGRGSDTEEFLSTLSLRRATRNSQNIKRRHKISIHALLAESDDIRPPNLPSISISIHALLAESDRARVLKRKAGPISIHALLAESDQ